MVSQNSKERVDNVFYENTILKSLSFLVSLDNFLEIL